MIGDDRQADAVAARLERLSPARRELLERLRGGRTSSPATAAVGDGRAGADPFPLTEVQEAYWVGRDPEIRLGGVAAHGYGEFDVEQLDLERLEAAWNRLIERHPALRTVISPDGTQRFLESVPRYAIAVDDHRELSGAAAEDSLAQTRATLSHRVPRPDQWPLFDVRATRMRDGRTRVHVGFDTLIADARSFEILADELDVLLADPDAALPPIELTFRDYVTAAPGEHRERARAYWLDRLDALPAAPELPLEGTGDVRAASFSRHSAVLAGDAWRDLCERAQRARVTPSVALLSAYAEVLAAWSAAPRFTLNLTLFDRRPVHPGVNQVVGCFTELSLLAVDMRPGGTFAERARRIQDQLWDDLEHREIGAMTVLRELARRGAPAAMPVVFTSALGTGGGGRSTLGRPVYAISQTPQVWIDHQVVEADDGIELWWDVAEDVFPAGMIADLFAAYRRLVEDLAAHDAPWDTPPRIGPTGQALAERRNVERVALREAPALLHELVDLRRRDVPAVTGASGTRSRGALDEQANRLAAALQDAGAERNRLVGVLTARGGDQVAAVLGVLRAGAAYLPLSPELPAGRLAELIARARVDLVVTDAHTADAPLPPGVRRMRADAGLPDNAPRPHGNLPGDLAYVIFTSGSTGTPKGVMIAHSAAANTLHDLHDRFALNERDAVLAASDLGFDLSVFDIFGLLAAGGIVVTVGQGVAAKDPAHWAELAARHAVTIWNSVPALMDLLADHLAAGGRRLDALRIALLSGDWIPVDLPERVRAVAPGARVIGAGGATEAAIWSVAYQVDRVDPAWTSIPYGHPLTNQTARVRGHGGDELPDGVPGELHIGGEGVALGYWGEPALTAERFVPDPDRPGGRLYRTGDYARHIRGGNLEFLGRRDAQVKINGHRVGLAEIEGVLAAHPAVAQACAVATGPRDGVRQLRVFAVAAGADAEALRAHLAAQLPPYMVPAGVELLDALPLTRNGKVDRGRLGELAAPTAPAVMAAAPDRERPIADAVARIVAEVLELEHRPGHGEDLLALGADSFAIVRIGHRIERILGFAPRLERVFADPTAAGIAAECERTLLERATQRPVVDAWDGSPAAAARIVPAGVPLAERAVPAGSPLPVDWGALRTRRRPRDEQLRLDALGGLLAPLRAIPTAVGDRRRYASAGALYPVRVYVAAHHVEALTTGVYAYDAAAHTLGPVGREPLSADEFEPFVNRPIVERAAFVLLLSVFAPAIAAVYGAHAERFATLEAGAIAQLLRESAAASGIALCAIGDAATPAIERAADLEPGESVVLIFAGGPLDPDEPVDPLPERETGEL